MSRVTRSVTAVFATLGLSFAGAGVATAANQGSGPYIIGGTTVDSAPWGAQVYHDGGGQYGGFMCSGTVIDDSWVLTAQHCLNEDGGMHVRVGDVNLNEGPEIDVDRTEASPNGDILLLHLDHSANTETMDLASQDPNVGDQNDIYGWGREQGNGPPASQLKTATVNVTGSSTDAFDGPAIQSKGDSGATWHGDSGGPEVANGEQVGVASTGQNSGYDPHGTQNYASVSANLDWIEQTAGL